MSEKMYFCIVFSLLSDIPYMTAFWLSLPSAHRRLALPRSCLQAFVCARLLESKITAQLQKWSWAESTRANWLRYGRSLNKGLMPGGCMGGCVPVMPGTLMPGPQCRRGQTGALIN